MHFFFPVTFGDDSAIGFALVKLFHFQCQANDNAESYLTQSTD